MQCNIGFAELAINLSDEHSADTIPVLIDILKDVPHIDFDSSLAWEGNHYFNASFRVYVYGYRRGQIGRYPTNLSIPSSLPYSNLPTTTRNTESLSLMLSWVSRRPLLRGFSRLVVCKPCLWSPAQRLTSPASLFLAAEILSQFAPAFHGFYRALISTTYRWTPHQWVQLSKNLNPLFDQHSIEALNRLVTDIVQLEETDPEAIHFVTTLLARYVSRGRPLSGYFLICCVIEVQWTVLTQALIPLGSGDEGVHFSEAAAANHACASLLRSSVAAVPNTDRNFAAAVEVAKELSMECFTDILVQVEEMENVPSQDSYASETMSESLVSCWSPERTSKPKH